MLSERTYTKEYILYNSNYYIWWGKIKTEVASGRRWESGLKIDCEGA